MPQKSGKGREISMNIISSTCTIAMIPKYSYVYTLEGKFNIFSKTKKMFLREFSEGT